MIIELNDPNAILCHVCEKKVINLSSLEQKLDILKVEINEKLSHLQITAGKRQQSVPVGAPVPI